jgi:hypothetical protein
MARTKASVRPQQPLVTANQRKRKDQKHRATNAAKSVAKHAIVSRSLLHPICNFRIPVTKTELSMEQWNAYAPQRFYYGVPKQIKYGGENQLDFLRIPVTKERQLVGYVTIPVIYEHSWRYLCYHVEWWLAMWKSWDSESKKKMTKKYKTKAQQERAALVVASRKIVGTRFLEAMVARRTIVADCIANGLTDGRIPSLDEFIIRTKRDWLFTEFDELPDDADQYLKADPLHTDNKALFGMQI